MDSEFTETAFSGEATEIDLTEHHEMRSLRPATYPPAKTYHPADVYPYSSSECDQSGPEGFFMGISGKTVEVVIYPDTSFDIIYVNPVPGPVVIRLEAGLSKPLTIKDVTLQFAPTSAYNIVITPATSEVMIEYYDQGVLRAHRDAGYLINSDGGAVTFRYHSSLMTEIPPCWIIESQVIGNLRTLATTTISRPAELSQ